jgi:hypothetical protein
MTNQMLKILGWSVGLSLVAVGFAGMWWLSVPDNVTVWRGEKRLLAKDHGKNMGYGVSVAMGEKIAAIGAPLAEPNGAVYIFERSKEVWTQVAKLQSQDADALGFGQQVSMDGNTLTVSTSKNILYVFTRQGVTWKQQARLSDNSSEVYDIKHSTIDAPSSAISQNTIVLSLTPLRGSTLSSVYVFNRDEDSSKWSQPIQLAAPPSNKGSLGKDVAINGKNIAINNGSEYGGDVHIYTKQSQSNEWLYQTTVNASDQPGTERSIAISEDTMVVGVPTEKGKPAISTGAVYVFQQDVMGLWQRQAKLVPQGINNGGFFENFLNPYRFGSRIIIQNDLILVGACTGSSGSTFFDSPETAAFLYQKDSGAAKWQQKAKLLGDFNYGVGCYDMKIWNDQILIGDATALNPNKTSGTAFVFDLKQYLPTFTITR